MSTTDLTDGFGHWLAGFADGEGCFRLIQHRVGPGLAISAQFQISLRADDRPILEEIRQRTGLGNIHSNGRSAVNNGRPQVRWAVGDHAGCLVLVGLFDRYPLRAKKARDFAIWRDAVMELGRIRQRPKGQREYELVSHLWDQLRLTREWPSIQPPQ